MRWGESERRNPDRATGRGGRRKASHKKAKITQCGIASSHFANRSPQLGVGHEKK